MKFLLLGTGGWISPPSLDFVSILVKTRSHTILIDPSEGCVRRLQRIGINLEDIDLVLVTHSHGDHALGFPTLVIWLSHLKVNRKIRVIALESVIQDLKLLIKATRIEKHANNVVEYIPIKEEQVKEPSTVFQDDDVEIRAVLTKHTVECLAFRVTERASGKCLVYSGDTAPCENIIKISLDADVLIHETSCLSEEARDYGHSCVKDAIEIAKRAKAKLLVPTHFYATGDIVVEKTEVPVLVPIVNHWYEV